MKTTCAKAVLFCLSLFLLFFSIPNKSSAQTCITEDADMMNPWPVIEHGGNHLEYVKITKSGGSNDARDWLANQFTVDIWINPFYNYETIMSARTVIWKNGLMDHPYENLHLNFFPYNGSLNLGLGDGHGGNTDILITISETEWSHEWIHHWTHLTVTFDENNKLRLYINGNQPSGAVRDWTFVLKSPYLVIGSTGIPNTGFRGDIAGFRLWTTDLSENEINYIKDKSFFDETSFSTTHSGLYDRLVVNMVTTSNDVLSINGGHTDAVNGWVTLTEYGSLTRDAHYFNPRGPFPPEDLSLQRECNSIQLSWSDHTEESSGHGASHEVWRKSESDPATLLCTTNETFYIDSTGLEPGTEYTYTIKSKWLQPNWVWLYPRTMIYSHDSVDILSSVKTLPIPQEFSLTDDQCDGTVGLNWQPVPSASGYAIRYKVDGGDWNPLAEPATTSYTHTVDQAEQGLILTYSIEAAGDEECELWSPVITGTATGLCQTKPTGLTADVVSGNVHLNWSFTQSGFPATGFIIWRKTGSGGAWEKIAQSIPIDIREYTDGSASMCTGYFYKIMPYNLCGESDAAASDPTPEITIPPQFDNIFTHAGAFFDASKGYFNTKVLLEWKVNPAKLADIDAFEIYRKGLDESVYSLVSTITNKNATFWEDKAVEANTMFMYMIRATGECNTAPLISDSLTAIGFRTSTGIISGKVTYEGGNAVEGVEVRVRSEGTTRTKSIAFDGIDDKMISEKSVLKIDSLHTHALSVECWIRPELMSPGIKYYLFTEPTDTLFLCIRNMKPFAGVYANGQLKSIETGVTLQPGTWYHLAMNFNPDGIMELYVDGLLAGSSTFVPMASWTVPGDHIWIGGGNNTFFAGHIDEVRIWNHFRTAEEIKRDYTRLQAGSENGLIAYWRLNEGIGSSAYDISKSGELFHKNDLYFSGGSSPGWSDVTPSFEQLHPSGVTDASGNYIISGITYSGTGNIFSATPILGIHKFNPTDLNLFIGDNSPVHNNINFIDESSFRLTGTVRYKNTDFPVEGASVYIDNMQVFDEGGHPVLTNEHGELDIQVPIGEHYITVKKNRHVFSNNGQWPAPTEFDPYRKFYFEDDIYGIDFRDETTVIVAGRFVGGDREGNKIPGFDKSKNNIGTGTIELENEKGYDIDLTIAENSTIHYNTRTASGEYEMRLLPEQYIIKSVENSSYQMDPDDLGVLDLTTLPDLTTVHDTLWRMEEDSTRVIDSIFSYAYHFKQNYIYYALPSIVVLGEDEEEFTGEKEIVIANPLTEQNDTIDLSPGNSPFQYPVFSMGKTYDIDIRLYEKYYNDTVEDVVPVENATVSITNNLDMHSVNYSLKTDVNGKVNDYTSFRVGVPNMNKDEVNLASYTKTMTIVARTQKYDVSWPDADVLRAYALGVADAGGANFVSYGPETVDFILRDPPGSNSYTYLKKGSVFSIARDFSITKSSNSLMDLKIAMGSKFEAGGGLAGPVFSSVTQSTFGGGMEVTNSIGNNGEYRETYRFTKEFRTSSEPNAVGSMADIYIGKSTNMFFTETRNLRILPATWCSDNGLDHLGDTELADPGAGYTLGIRPGFAASGDTAATSFIYTQDHILNNLIPEYRMMTFNILANSPNYVSKVLADHEFYAMNNDAGIWRGTSSWEADSLHPSYVFMGDPTKEIDSIAFLNQQIAIWLQTIAMNEASKVQSENLVENVSFDGNAGAYLNEVTYSETELSEKVFNFTWDLFFASDAGFNIMGVGTMTANRTTKSFDRVLTEEDEQTHEITWGYVLDDAEQGDYFSIDIYQDDLETMEYYTDEFLNENNYEDRWKDLEKVSTGLGAMGAATSAIGAMLGKALNPLAGAIFNMASTAARSGAYIALMDHYKGQITDEQAEFGLTGTSPIFRIQGGQSRCPYEGPEYTFFHSDPTTGDPYILHVGTQAHEEPVIEIEPAVIVNVPANKEAVFTVKLNNNSPTDKDLTYMLKVDESSNPDGAVIKLDALSPNRPFYIPAGESLTKTLTVEKGATSNMDFENLQMILHSVCQFNPDDHYPDIADTVNFSVHFLPACTEVEFGNVLDNWVLNDSYDDTMMINLTGYDINHAKLDKLLFQYAKPGYTPVTAMSFYKNEDDFNVASEPKKWLEGNATMNYNWPVHASTDGTYELTLKSVCYDGSTYPTDKLTGVIDRVLPGPFGAPQPSDGVLSTGEEISILFNEEIDAGNLYVHKDYITVTGMLNGTDLTTAEELLHDVSLHFDGGNQNVTIPAGINLSYSPFTFEFWAKRSGTGKECILSQGDPDIGGLWIGFDDSDHFIMRMAGQTVTSNDTYGGITGQWCHFACIYNNGIDGQAKAVTLIIATAATTEEKYQEVGADYMGSGGLMMGNGPDGNGFEGYLQHVRLWSTYRTINEINAQRYQLLSGYERGLTGYWPMDDAAGDIARELASGKNGLVSATWSVSRDNKAIGLDGTGYVSFDAGTMVFHQQADFTIEFWFKAGQQDACLISNGKADGTDGYVSNWAILTHATGEITILNHGKQLFGLPSGFLDDQWHHLALVIDRQSSARLYMDGDLKQTASVSGLAGFGSSKAALGTRWWYDLGDYNDMNLDGYMDEIRIWNSARNQNLIRENMYTALSGNEPGLKAYFPFENVNVSDPSVSVNTLENSTTDTIGVAGNCVLSTGAEHIGESPTIKLPRPVISIPFNYIINNDVVLIQPTIEPSLIENQILTFSIRNVRDLHNNRMASTVTWTAFIDINSLVWSDSEISLEKEPDEEKEFTVQIVNKGGQKEYFTISNYPDWLEVSDDRGSIEPLGSKEITFNVFPGLNPGQYTANLYLSGNLEYNERLLVDVDIKVEPPDWEVNENAYQYSMSVIGQLKIDETLSTDENDLVGAFLGKECVGTANVTYFSDQDIYLVFINIFSNNPGAGSIHFKVWDADQGRIYPEVTPILDFKADDLVGNATNPQSIHALNLYANNIALAKGWNWISFNLNTDKLASLDEFLLDLDLQQDDDLIKNKVAYSQYNGVNWQGTLSGMEIGKMYMMMISQAQDFVYSGEPVVTGDMQIQLEEGWNWIGYTPQGNMTVKEAFGYHIPMAGDVVKSQFSFAIYDDLMGWIGSMQYMRPGLGYKYYSGDAATFYYPEKSSMKSLVEVEIPEAPEYIHQWPNSMNMIARIVPGDRVTEDYLVYAFRDKYITGLGLPVYNSNTSEWLWFVQVYGDTAGDKIGFIIENASGTEKLTAREEILFQADRIVGTLSEPVELTLGDPGQMPSGIRVYPNPFTDALNVAVSSSDNLRIELTDLEGRVIWNYEYESVGDKYLHTLDLSSDLSEGVYILKIMDGTGTHYQKIIKQ